MESSTSRLSPKDSSIRGDWSSCPTVGCSSPNGRGDCASSTADGKLSEPLTGVPQVFASGQGGLLDVALDPDFAKDQLIYLSFAEPGEGRRRHGGRARPSRRARAREHAGDLAAAAQGRRAATTSARASSSAATARCSSRRAIASTSRAGAGPRRDARQGRAHQRRRLDPARQPLRRPRRRAARDLVLRPSQRPGRRAAPGDRPALDHRARRARRRRAQPSAKPGKNYGWPVITYGIDYSGAKIGEGTAKAGWSSPSTTGTRSSPPRA